MLICSKTEAGNRNTVECENCHRIIVERFEERNTDCNKVANKQSHEDYGVISSADVLKSGSKRKFGHVDRSEAGDQKRISQGPSVSSSRNSLADSDETS